MTDDEQSWLMVHRKIVVQTLDEAVSIARAADELEFEVDLRSRRRWIENDAGDALWELEWQVSVLEDPFDA